MKVLMKAVEQSVPTLPGSFQHEAGQFQRFSGYLPWNKGACERASEVASRVKVPPLIGPMWAFAPPGPVPCQWWEPCPCRDRV